MVFAEAVYFVGGESRLSINEMPIAFVVYSSEVKKTKNSGLFARQIDSRRFIMNQ